MMNGQMKTLQSVDKLNIQLYHPIPFDGYERIKSLNEKTWRKDSEERFIKIYTSYEYFCGKSLIDIGCANGYFLFRFIQEGGQFAEGVEVDLNHVNFINLIAKEEGLNVIASNELPNKKFDIGLFLDFYHPDDSSVKDYPDYIGKNCLTAFVSSSNNSGGNNKDLAKIMNKYYKNVQSIHTGFQDREIYKCSN